ncbi:MAG: SOS response-associated peptidase [Candidatus Rifleibacteriota bacterium]
MCGRFTLTGNLLWLIRYLEVNEPGRFVPRYNIAPGQPVIVFLYDHDSGNIRHDFQVWGLVHSFSKDLSKYKPLINARAESIDEKISFKRAFRYRRCVIPATGFYEWQRIGGQKLPWYFSLKDKDELMCFAGIWDIWHGEGGEQVNSCAIITTGANENVAKIHHRMPVILPKEQIKNWLNFKANPSGLKKLLRPFPAERMQSWRVDPIVNNPHNESPECIKQLPILQPNLF